MNELCRRTGRTTKMLEDAYGFYEKGYRVFVLTHTHNYINQMRRLLPKQIMDSNSITFKVFDPMNDDFIRGLDDCVILVDHLAMECLLRCSQSGYSLFTPIEYSCFISNQRQLKYDHEKMNEIRKILKGTI